MARKSRRIVAQALVYGSGRVRWGMLADTAEDAAAQYPVDAICRRHLTALAAELRAWHEVRS